MEKMIKETPEHFCECGHTVPCEGEFCSQECAYPEDGEAMYKEARAIAKRALAQAKKEDLRASGSGAQSGTKII